MFDNDKRPRVYAAEILALPRDQQATAFEAVPDHLKGIVRVHCLNTKRFERFKKTQIGAGII